MLTLVVTSILAAVSSVQRAEQLYQQARYEDALKALGTSCENTPSVRENDILTCERIRAFSLVALGRENEARAAFDRMLARNPDGDLGSDVSPKLQSLFSAAKRDLAQVMALELEPVSPGAGGPWPISVKVPGDLAIDELHAYVAMASTSRYTEVPMRQSGGAWVGMYEPPGEPSAPRYYLVATLPSGVDVSVGDATTPKAVVLGAARDPMGYESSDAPHAEPRALKATRKTDDDEKIAGMPKWAFWTVVGGSAVVVTAVIIFAATRGGGDDSGAVRVGLTFQ